MGKLVQALLDAGHTAVEKMFMPEVAAYHWVKRKLGLEEAALSNGNNESLDNLPENEWRFVDYYAASCPHCTHLLPDWDKAADQWALEHGDMHVKFVKMQCLDDAWKPGPDMEACQAANVHAFPTLKMYGPQGKVMEYNQPGRSPEDLINFVKQSVGLEPLAPPTEPQAVDEEMFKDLHYSAPEKDSMIEYFATSCPHCQKLTPTWDAAVADFKTKHPEVPWIQKECLDSSWHPGKDFKECISNDIGSFPTIRYETKGGVFHDFTGKRTPEELEKFAEAEMKYFKEHPEQAIRQEEPAVAEQEAKGAAEEPTAEADGAAAPAADAAGAAPPAEHNEINEVKADSDVVKSDEAPVNQAGNNHVDDVDKQDNFDIEDDDEMPAVEEDGNNLMNDDKLLKLDGNTVGNNKREREIIDELERKLYGDPSKDGVAGKEQADALVKDEIAVNNNADMVKTAGMGVAAFGTMIGGMMQFPHERKQQGSSFL